jgi:hypothetical protein
MDEKKIKKVAGFLGLYYLLFAVYIKFPEAHSLLGDLYQGALDSYTVLELIHNRPSDSSHGFFDDHAFWIVSIDKSLLCMIYSHSYPGTQKTSRKLLVAPMLQKPFIVQTFLQKYLSTGHCQRAPPSESA